MQVGCKRERKREKVPRTVYIITFKLLTYDEMGPNKLGALIFFFTESSKGVCKSVYTRSARADLDTPLSEHEPQGLVPQPNSNG